MTSSGDKRRRAHIIPFENFSSLAASPQPLPPALTQIGLAPLSNGVASARRHDAAETTCL